MRSHSPTLGWSAIIVFGTLVTVCHTCHWAYCRLAETCLQLRDYVEDSLESTRASSKRLRSPPRAFPRFAQLPLEIRAEIWRHALPAPRTIEVRHDPAREPGSCRCQTGSVRSTARIPPLLHACRESRAEALRCYELAFGHACAQGRRDGEDEADQHRPKIYVDFVRDTIYFGRRSEPLGAAAKGLRGRTMAAGRLQDLEKIQHLALRTRSYAELARLDLSGFSALREVVAVSQCAEERRFDLGRTPLLRRGGEIGLDDLGEEVLVLSSELAKLRGGERGVDTDEDADVEVRNRIGAREAQATPKMILGTFEKTAGDRWYCKKRGPRWAF